MSFRIFNYWPRVIAGIITVILSLFHCNPCRAEDTTPRVAVLNFENYAGSGMAEYVNSIPSMLMTSLAGNTEYIMVERLSVEKAADNFAFELSGMADQERIIQVGRWLGATHLITGSIGASGDETRIDCRLIDARYGFIIRTFCLKVKNSNMLGAADELGGLVAGYMAGRDGNEGAVKGRLEINFKLTLAPLAAGPIYYHRVKLYINDIYMGTSDIIKKENNLYKIFSIQIPPGEYNVKLMHGYVDQKNGKWESDYEIQPEAASLQVRSDHITSLDYEYNTGFFKNSYAVNKPRIFQIVRQPVQ